MKPESPDDERGRFLGQGIDRHFVAELVEHPKDWPFAGAVVPGYPEIHPLEEDFLRLFWKLYVAARAPGAGDIRRPPLS